MLTCRNQGMLRPLVFAPVVACRNARHATSSACPTIVAVVGHLLTDLCRLEYILPDGGISTRLREQPVLRRLVPQIVGVFHSPASSPKLMALSGYSSALSPRRQVD